MWIAYVCSRPALFKCSSRTSVFTQTAIRMSNNAALLMWFRLYINVCLSWPNYHPYWTFLLNLFSVWEWMFFKWLTAVLLRYHDLFFKYVHLAITFFITWPRKFSRRRQITHQVRQTAENFDDAVDGVVDDDDDNDDIMTAYNYVNYFLVSLCFQRC